MTNSSNTLTSIIKILSEKTGLSQAKVKRVLSQFLDTTMDAVSEGQRVVLRGFGTFSKKDRKPR